MEKIKPAVMLIPARAIAEQDAEKILALRNRIRRGERRREREIQEKALSAPDFEWRATRRR